MRCNWNRAHPNRACENVLSLALRKPLRLLRIHRRNSTKLSRKSCDVDLGCETFACIFVKRCKKLVIQTLAAVWLAMQVTRSRCQINSDEGRAMQATKVPLLLGLPPLWRPFASLWVLHLFVRSSAHSSSRPIQVSCPAGFQLHIVSFFPFLHIVYSHFS